MEYKPAVQYRCEIIRGKAISALDSILPTYATIIEELCPCPKQEFDEGFNAKLAAILPPGTEKKTLDNHRSEIAGKLFGMYYQNEEDIVYPSERTLKYLTDTDQPAFFKDICLKFQFPNGMNKIQTVCDHLANGIRIRQYPFILRFLQLARIESLYIRPMDIYYYVLNALHVLQGKVNPETVIEAIKEDRALGIMRTVPRTPGKALSWDTQHLREQMNYLALANLIRIDRENVVLNMKEEKAITHIASKWDKPLPFDAYSYDLSTKEGRNSFYYEWQHYYSKLSPNNEVFGTTAESLDIVPVAVEPGVDTTAIGDEGELIVFEFERDRVKKYNPRLVGKVVHLGKTKGLGYDIQSVVAEPGDFDEFVKYIEVKTTKRVTAPDIGDAAWVDTVHLTRNEWVAASQHKDSYSIYRVYLTVGKVLIYVIKDVVGKSKNGLLSSVPLNYRVDFSNVAVDAFIERNEMET